MSRLISEIVDTIADDTFGFVVHDDDSFDVVPVSPMSERWSRTASTKSLKSAVDSLSAHLVVKEPQKLTSKKVAEVADFLDEKQFVALIDAADDDVFVDDVSWKDSAGRRRVSNRARRGSDVPSASVNNVPLDRFSSEERLTVLRYKAASALTDSKIATYELQIKAARAIFDPNIGPGGGWRCPNGTMFGGQITDRFGRGCGGSLTRRIGRAIMNAGRTGVNAATPRETRRLQRAAQRGGRQAARRSRRQMRAMRRNSRVPLARRLRISRDQQLRAIGRETAARILIGDYRPPKRKRPTGRRRGAGNAFNLPIGPTSQFPPQQQPTPQPVPQPAPGQVPGGQGVPGGRPSIPVPGGGQPGGRPRVPGGQPGGRPRVPGGQGGGRPRRPRTPPDNPRPGQRWTDDDGRVWIWNQGDGFPPKGRGWSPEDGQFFPDREESNEPPESPLNGDEWTDADGRTFVWTVDTSGKNPPQWVEKGKTTSRPRIDVPEVPTAGPTSEVRPGQNNTGRERTTRDRIPDPSRNLTPDEIRRLTPEQKRQLLEEIEAQRIDPADLPEVDNRDVINVENYSPNGIPETAFWRERDWGGFSLEAYKDRMERRFGRYYYDEDGNLNERGRAVMEVIRQRRRDQNEEVLRELMGDAAPPSRRRERRRERDEEAGRTTPEMYRDPETGNLINTETGEIVERGPERERVGETPSPQRSLRERVSAAIERAAQRLLDNETPASRRRRRGNEATRRQQLADAIERAAQRLLQENDRSRFGRREDNRRRRRRGETDAADEDLRRRLEQDIREELGLDRERDPDAAPEDLERDKQIEEEAGRIVDAMVEPDESAESVDKISEDFDRWNDVMEGVVDSIENSDLDDKEKARLRKQARDAIQEIGQSWGNKDRLDEIRQRRRRTSAAKDPSLSDQGQAYSDRINRMVQGALDARERSMSEESRERADRPAPPTRIPGFSAEASERKPMREIPDWREVDDNDLNQLVEDIRDADFRSMDSDMRRQAAERYRAAVREQQRRAAGRDVPEVSNQQRRFVRDRMRGMVPSRPYWRDESFTGDRDRLERQLGSMYEGDGPDARLTEAGRNLRNDMESEKRLIAERLREARTGTGEEVEPVGSGRKKPDGLGGEVDVPGGDINPDAELGSEENLDELGQWVNSLPDDPEFDYVRREAQRLDRQIREVYDDPAALRKRRVQLQELRDNYDQMVTDAGDDADERNFMNRYVTTAQAALDRINRRISQLDRNNSRDGDNPDFTPEQLRLFDKFEELLDGDPEDQDVLDPIVRRTDTSETGDETPSWSWDDPVENQAGNQIPTEISEGLEQRASEMPEDLQDKYRYLARFAEYGPTYNRGVAEALADAHRFRNDDNVRYYMAQAEQSAHRAITGERASAPRDNNPDTSMYSSLPWNAPAARVDPDSDAEARETLTDQWAFKTVGEMRDAVRESGSVAPMLDRVRKLRRWGQQGDEERRAAVEAQVKSIARQSPLPDDLVQAIVNIEDDDDFEAAVESLNEFIANRVQDFSNRPLYSPDFSARDPLNAPMNRIERLTGSEFPDADLDDDMFDDISRARTGLPVDVRQRVGDAVKNAQVEKNSLKRAVDGDTADDYPDVTVMQLGDALENIAELEDAAQRALAQPDINEEDAEKIRRDVTWEQEQVLRAVNSLLERYLGENAPRVMASDNYKEIAERLRNLVRDEDNNTITDNLLPEAARPSFDDNGIAEKSDDELQELLADLDRYIDDENKWFGPDPDFNDEPEYWERGMQRYIRERDLRRNMDARRARRDQIRQELERRDNPVDGFDGTSGEVGRIAAELDEEAGVEDIGDEARRNVKDLMTDAWRRRRQRMSKIVGYDPENPPWENEEARFPLSEMRSLADADPDDSRLVDGKPSPEVEAKAREFAKQMFEISYVDDNGNTIRSSVGRTYVRKNGSLFVSGTITTTLDDGEELQIGFFQRELHPDGTIWSSNLALDNVELGTGKGLERMWPQITGLDYEVDVYASRAVERRALSPSQRSTLDEIAEKVKSGELEPGLYELNSEFGFPDQMWLVLPDDQRRAVGVDSTPARSSGFGSAFNLHSWNWARSAGWTNSEASGGMDDGDYVWGRMGYRPQNREQNESLWGSIDEAITAYNNGESSIIENDRQRDALSELSQVAKSDEYDPDVSPSFAEAILLLEAGSTDPKRSDKVKKYLRDRKALFKKGNFVFDDRITETPSDPSDPDRTGSSQTVGGDALTKAGRAIGTGGVEMPNHIIVPRDSPEGSVINGNDTSTVTGAVDHLRAGGSIDDIPNELVPDALRGASGEDGPYVETSAGTFVKRDPDGSLSQQGWRVVDRDSAQVRIIGEEEQSRYEDQLTPNALLELSPGFETWVAEGEADVELAPAVVDDAGGDISFDVVDPKTGVAAILPKGARSRVFVPGKSETRAIFDAPVEGGDGKHYWTNTYVWIDTRKLPKVKVGYTSSEEERAALTEIIDGPEAPVPPPRNADVTLEGVISRAKEATDELTVVGTAKQKKDEFVLLRDSNGRIHAVNARYFDGIVRNDSSLRFYTDLSKFEEGKTFPQISVRNAEGETVAGIMPIKTSITDKGRDWVESAQEASGVSREGVVAARVSNRILKASAQGSGKNRRIPFDLENEEEFAFMISELENRIDVIEDMVADMDGREAISLRSTQRSLAQLRNRLSEELQRRRDSRSLETGTPLDQMVASQTAAMVGITNQGGFHAGKGTVVLPLPGNSFENPGPRPDTPRFEDAINEDEYKAIVPRMASLMHRYVTGMNVPDHISFIPVVDENNKVLAVVPDGEVGFTYTGLKNPPILSNALGDITLFDDLREVISRMNRQEREEIRDEMIRQVEEIMNRAREAARSKKENFRLSYTRGMSEGFETPLGYNDLDGYIKHLDLVSSNMMFSSRTTLDFDPAREIRELFDDPSSLGGGE